MIIVVLFIVSALIFKVTRKSKHLYAVIVVSLLMSILAYYLTDKNQYDLIFHRELYDSLAEGGIDAAIIYSMVNSSPLYIWLVYLLSFFQDNRLTSAVPTFLGYFFILFILFKISEEKNVNKNRQAIFVFFILAILPWQDFSAGIRGALAYSMCSMAIFIDFKYKKTLLAIIMYIMAIYIHQAAIVFLILRIFISIINRYPFTRKPIYFLCLTFGLFFRIIGDAALFIANSLQINILLTVSNSYKSYVIDDGQSLYEYKIVFLRVAAMLLIYFIYKKGRKRESNNDVSVFRIFTMLMLVALGFIWQYDIICRYSVASFMIAPFFLYNSSNKSTYLLFFFAIVNLLFYYQLYYVHWEILFS